MKRRGGYKTAMEVIGVLARRGLFRQRDLNESQLSHNWLNIAADDGLLRRHGHGVWGHRSYEPTRYELAQIRLPSAVFWGPSALWLLGAEAHEPEALWIAIGNKARPPRTLELSTVIRRLRKLNDDVVSVQPQGRVLRLRVHAEARARADVSRIDPHKLLERAADRAQFSVPRKASFLSADLKTVTWHPIPAPREEWVATRHLTP